jgi:hypothetical protein
LEAIHATVGRYDGVVAPRQAPAIFVSGIVLGDVGVGDGGGSGEGAGIGAVGAERFGGLARVVRARALAVLVASIVHCTLPQRGFTSLQLALANLQLVLVRRHGPLPVPVAAVLVRWRRRSRVTVRSNVLLGCRNGVYTVLVIFFVIGVACPLLLSVS